MAEPDASRTTKSAYALGAREKHLTSTLLILLTIAVAAACIFLLSTTLTQTRLSAVVIDGVSIGIRKLDQVVDRWGQLHHYLVGLTEAENKKAAATAKATAAQATRTARHTEIEGLLVGFYRRIESIDQPLASQIHNRGYDDQVGYIRAAKERLHTGHPEYDPIILSIETTFDAMLEADGADASAQAETIGATALVTLLQQNVESTKTISFNLIGPSLDKGSQARVENALYELNVYKSSSALYNQATHFFSDHAARSSHALAGHLHGNFG